MAYGLPTQQCGGGDMFERMVLRDAYTSRELNEIIYYIFILRSVGVPVVFFIVACVKFVLVELYHIAF